MTYVDRFSKRFRLIPSRDTDSTTDVADAFFERLFPLHGLPDSVVSDGPRPQIYFKVLAVTHGMLQVNATDVDK